MAYKTLVDQDQLTPENLRKAQYLGWCVEMVNIILIIRGSQLPSVRFERKFPSEL